MGIRSAQDLLGVLEGRLIETVRSAKMKGAPSEDRPKGDQTMP